MGDYADYEVDRMMDACEYTWRLPRNLMPRPKKKTNQEIFKKFEEKINLEDF